MDKFVITTTDTIGFCFGVKRTMDKLYEEIEKNNGDRIFTFGEIVHNPDVNEKLRKNNVFICEDIDKIPSGSKVFIRTHGLPKEIVTKLKASGLKIFDMTCPRVVRIHEIVSLYDSVIITGDKNHPEVDGIKGHCLNKCYIVKNVEELNNIISKLERQP